MERASMSIMNTSTPVSPYSILARIYDDIMAHVDYPRWTRFVMEILISNGLPSPNTQSPPYILECACGTGSFTILLALRGYRIDAFDQSSSMLEIARQKSTGLPNAPNFFIANMRSLESDKTYDAAICLYDSVNYLLEPAGVMEYFTQVRKVLKPEGLFLFDICTELNSRLHFTDRNESGRGKGYRYIRKMNYHQKERLQENRFEIFLEGQAEPYIEIHHQRIYTAAEIKEYLKMTGWSIVEQTDEYRHRPAHKNSLRIHFLCRQI